jgi:uncharacterized protein (TIGR02646 family)
MKTILKGFEPASLTLHRLSPHASYANYSEKQELRESLVSEQRALCCYCLSRIKPQPESMKVAHWHPQSTHPGEQLVYKNLLGACLGNEGQPRRSQHCDTFQADRDLSKNPAEPSHRVESLTRYQSDGTITSNDTQFDSELNDVLNLNMPFLKNNRKAVVDGLKDAIQKRGSFSKSMLEGKLREWNGEGHAGPLEPFCQVVVYWLRKRLRRP